MKLSLNEVTAALTKAARGQGWSPAPAVEFGRAAAWLCARDPVGLSAALDCLGADPDTASAKRRQNVWQVTASSVIAAGPSAFDLLESTPGSTIILDQCDVPKILIGYAGLFATQHNARYDLSDGLSRVRVTPGGFSDDGTLSGTKIQVERVEGASPDAPDPHKAVDASNDIWRSILKLAAKSYVPATDASRLSGAGAGLTDND